MKHFTITPVNWAVSVQPDRVAEARIATGRVWIERNTDEKDNEENPYLLLMTGGPFTDCTFERGSMEKCQNKAQEMHDQAISQFLTEAEPLNEAVVKRRAEVLAAVRYPEADTAHFNHRLLNMDVYDNRRKFIEGYMEHFKELNK